MEGAMIRQLHPHHVHVVAWVTISAPALRPRSLSSFGNAQPLRTRMFRRTRPLLAMSTISETSSADDYAQFANMLDKGTSPGSSSSSDSDPPTFEESQVANADKESYAEFSELLGVAEGPSKSDSGDRSIAEATPRKIVIDPGDYDVFDSLLRQTGGTGRKPVKGSKRYASRPVPTPVRSKGARKDEDEHKDSSNGETVTSEPRTGSYLSEEETAQAYSVMMEEFGAGIHGSTVVTPTASDDADVKPKTPTLMKPPTRPGEISRRRSNVELPTTLNDDGKDIEPETSSRAPTTPILKPKPRTPASIHSDIDASENIVEKADTLYEETGEVPPAGIHDETLSVLELQPKPAFPEEDVIGVSSETGAEEVVSQGISIWKKLEGPPDVRRPAQLRKPPSRPGRGTVQGESASQMDESEAMWKRKREQRFDDVEAETLQNPKLVCDIE